MTRVETVMEADEFFLTLGALLEERRALLRTKATITFRLIDGSEYSVELGGRIPVRPGATADADVFVLCNRRALSDLMLGRFDPSRPNAEHLFLWAGDDGAFAALARALGGARSWLDARAVFQKGGM